MIYLFSRGLEPWPFPRFFLQKNICSAMRGKPRIFIYKKRNKKRPQRKKQLDLSNLAAS